MGFFDDLTNWKDFEDLVSELFRARGWVCTYKPAVGPDRSRDIMCVKTVEQGLSQYQIKMLVQCKFHKGKRWKAVNEKDVGSIYEIAKSYGVNLFLVATNTKLTSNLQDLLARLTAETDIQFRSLIGAEIETEVRRDDKIFMRFFPNQYRYHIQTLDAVTEYSVARIFHEVFGREVSERELHSLMYLKYHYRIPQISYYEAVWRNATIRSDLDKLYRRLLTRSVDPVGWLEYGYALLYGGADIRHIKQQILRSNEYLQRLPKVKVDFLDQPIMEVLFDRYGLQVMNWWTYHKVDYRGAVKVVYNRTKGKIVEISPSVANKSFRIAFPISRLQIKKSRIKIRFKTNEWFEFFTLVRGSDERLYYLTFIPEKTGKKIRRTAPPGDHVPYGFAYIGTAAYDGRWHTVKRDLGYLLRTLFKTNLASVEYFCLHVKGLFTLDYIELY